MIGVILAAGEGTRFKSEIPKVLHKISGKEIILWCLDAIRPLGLKKIFIIVGHKSELIRNRISSRVGLSDDDIIFIEQKKQLGSGDALLKIKAHIKNKNDSILVICGDVPLIEERTLYNLISKHKRENADITILTADLKNPSGYGRIIRDPFVGDLSGRITGIKEDRDVNEEEQKITEINAGIYCFKADLVFDALRKVKPDNKKGEYYLTDAVQILNKTKRKIASYKVKDSQEIMGINNRVELAEAERTVNEKKIKKLMLSGVTIIAPDNTYIDVDVKIGKDTVIYPGVFLIGNTKIGNNCRIGPFTFISDSVIHNRVEIRSSFIYSSIIQSNVKIGPYSHIRPESIVKSNSKIGNFTELKKSKIGKGSKVPHLSYIGDSNLGRNVNIGAGTITCNFDGKAKHKTEIEDSVFVGSNVNLIAPVRIGRGAVIGAGSTINEDVPPGTLAIARARQVIKERKRKL